MRIILSRVVSLTAEGGKNSKKNLKTFPDLFISLNRLKDHTTMETKRDYVLCQRLRLIICAFDKRKGSFVFIAKPWR